MEDVESSVREKILREYDEMMNEDRERDWERVNEKQ